MGFEAFLTTDAKFSLFTLRVAKVRAKTPKDRTREEGDLSMMRGRGKGVPAMHPDHALDSLPYVDLDYDHLEEEIHFLIQEEMASFQPPNYLEKYPDINLTFQVFFPFV